MVLQYNLSQSTTRNKSFVLQKQKPYLNLTDLTLHQFLFRNSSHTLNHPSLFVSHLSILLPHHSRIPCKLYPHISRRDIPPHTVYTCPNIIPHPALSSQQSPLIPTSLFLPTDLHSSTSSQSILIECCDNTNKT